MSANIGKNVVFLAFIRQKYPNTGGGDTFAGECETFSVNNVLEGLLW